MAYQKNTELRFISSRMREILLIASITGWVPIMHAEPRDRDDKENGGYAHEEESSDSSDYGAGDTIDEALPVDEQVVYRRYGTRVELDPQDIRDFGMRIAQAGGGEIRAELTLPGEIRMNETAVAHVGPRFDGIVTAIHKRLGESVQAGDFLAEMESNETLRPFKLEASISGTIVEFHITQGESLTAGEYAYIIANTETVWADLKVYQRDLPKVRKGQRVRISAGRHFATVEGEIAYLGPVVDEATRTGLARLVLPNPDGLYRAGLFITGRISLEEFHAPVVVPTTALHKVEGHQIVYVKVGEGEGFEARKVRVGRRDALHAEIRRGLNPGENYVVEGGFFLKADSQKEEFGQGDVD